MTEVLASALNQQGDVYLYVPWYGTEEPRGVVEMFVVHIVTDPIPTRFKPIVPNGFTYPVWYKPALAYFWWLSEVAEWYGTPLLVQMNVFLFEVPRYNVAGGVVGLPPDLTASVEIHGHYP